MSNISEYLELERRVEFEKSRAEAALACNTELNKQYFQKCLELDKAKEIIKNLEIEISELNLVLANNNGYDQIEAENKQLINYLKACIDFGDFTYQTELYNEIFKFLVNK
jgi:hypothetical protein